MNLLLDTHVFLWWNADAPTLGKGARSAIAERKNTAFVSAATAWEIAVKRAQGKLDVAGDIADWIEQNAFRALSIDVSHAIESATLPAHHRDPFDRLLVAQARLEGLTLVTTDTMIRCYDVATLDASA